MIARNHVTELRLRIRQRCRIRPVDIPIHRNLRPHQQSHAIRQANFILVVRIMRKPYEVTSQFFHPSQQSLCIFGTEGPPLAKRSLFMHRNPAQKDRLPVQQNLRALYLNRAEANLIMDDVIATLEDHIIKLGMLR